MLSTGRHEVDAWLQRSDSQEQVIRVAKSPMQIASGERRGPRLRPMKHRLYIHLNLVGPETAPGIQTERCQWQRSGPSATARNVRRPVDAFTYAVGCLARYSLIFDDLMIEAVAR